MTEIPKDFGWAYEGLEAELHVELASPTTSVG